MLGRLDSSHTLWCWLFAVLLAAFTVSCQDGESDLPVVEKTIAEGPPTIEVELAPRLRTDIQIVSKSLLKPGKNNRAEATIELRNTGATPIRFHARTTWLDARGNNNGGSTHAINLAPGQNTSISDATMSPRATRLHVLMRTEDFKSESLKAMSNPSRSR